MRNKLFITILLGLFLIGNVLALDSMGTGKQNQNFTIIQTCNDATYITLSTIQYPDKTYSLVEENMTSLGSGAFSYIFENTTQLGRYYMTGVSDGCENTFASYFDITPGGQPLDTSLSILIIFVLTILIFFLVFSIRGIFKADEGGWQIVYICLSYILLFSVFFLLWLVSKNYLYDLPILESVFWIIWLILSILFFPFIIIVSAYILKKQAEALMEKDFVQQGYTREEARDMSKKSRRR